MFPRGFIYLIVFVFSIHSLIIKKKFNKCSSHVKINKNNKKYFFSFSLCCNNHLIAFRTHSASITRPDKVNKAYLDYLRLSKLDRFANLLSRENAERKIGFNINDSQYFSYKRYN